ncbi:hypothetical protein [Gordonia soli]|uniref:Uncharacterized protein n=1 Tax=Gordonia soli NBRC 108243 TaxID=1223545 RepID=M0QPW1_9ACTN|nr:hypothetical protein [Gordonia soli]GAC70618.1 hypothetical protein GS4_38_00240 [Gordonia soli NBRC 108243]
MSVPRLSPRSWPGALIILCMAFAVMLMHSVITHADAGAAMSGSAASGSATAGSAMSGVPMAEPMHGMSANVSVRATELDVAGRDGTPHQGHADSQHADGHVAANSPAPQSIDRATTTIRTVIDSAHDCGVHQHGCVFARSGAPEIPLIIAILFWWGFPMVRAALGARPAGLFRLGRPPPWAVFSHLRLQVIRC